MPIGLYTGRRKELPNEAVIVAKALLGLLKLFGREIAKAGEKWQHIISPYLQ
jgi:hypothetical protein